MPWVTMGSREDIARKERSALNAYMFWTKTDCKTMTIAEALSKFGRELGGMRMLHLALGVKVIYCTRC